MSLNKKKQAWLQNQGNSVLTEIQTQDELTDAIIK